VAERKPTVWTRVSALAFGVVPGAAHIFVLDRTGWGTLFFVLFVFGADAAVAGLYLLDETWSGDAYTGGCILAGAAWLASWLDVARLTVFRDYEKRAALRTRLVGEGVRHYAAGRLRKAHDAFRECLDLDPRDTDVLFWYGCVEAALGRGGRARRAFRRCRKHDFERKWTFEIRRSEERLLEDEAAASATTKV
jgi:tetratricopeptide (TPR) repeat protein